MAAALLLASALTALPADATRASASTSPVRPAAGHSVEPSIASEPLPCQGWSDQTAPPVSVRVGFLVNGEPTSIASVPLQTYVERALATSWPASSPPAALEAAALAIKQIAWFHALEPTFDEGPVNACYDIPADLPGLPYDPQAIVEAAHVGAVDAIWPLSLRKADLAEPFFQPRFRDGDTDACGPAVEPLHTVLPRRGVLACALAGASRDEILHTYLDPDLAIVQLRQLAGPTRYETAVAVSQAMVARPPTPVVVIASGQDFPDAVSGGPAAAAFGGPILLVQGTKLPASVAGELSRLHPARIVVLGGPAVISDRVVAALRGYSPDVSRIYGADRYATSLAVAAAAFHGRPVPVVYVATGRNYPDALAGAAAGAHLGGPVLLVPGTTLPSAALRAQLEASLRDLTPPRIVLLGGADVVSEAYRSWLAPLAGAVDRLAGPDRYTTAAAVSADAYGAGSGCLYVASGLGFADALVAAPLGGPLLLAPGYGQAIDPAVLAEARRLGRPGVCVLGDLVVPDDAAAMLAGMPTPPASGRLLDAYMGLRPPWEGEPRDADGVPMTVYQGVAQYNPLQISQWGLTQFQVWLETGSAEARAAFLQMSDWLVDHQQADGRWLVTFDFGGQPIPWWSAQVEGEGISILLRAYQATGQEGYRAAAARALSTMQRPISQGGVTDVDRGSLWLEPYLPPYSRHTLNGHMFALEGAREYALVLGDATAASIASRALTTVRTWLYRFDTGTWSTYNIRGTVTTAHYHLIQLGELRHFFLITGAPELAATIARWAAYAEDPPPGVKVAAAGESTLPALLDGP